MTGFDREGLYRRASAKTSASTRFVGGAGATSFRNSGRDADSSGRPKKMSLTGVEVSKDIADEILQNFMDDDNTTGAKTWSRIFVEKFLSKYEWYYPKSRHKHNPDPPSLDKAWAYYEHVTLPRHIVGEGATDTVIRRAEPGEHERQTELFNPLLTPQSSMIEWGTGVDLYFISLQAFAVILFIFGLINISSIEYYASDDYTGGKNFDFTLSAALTGSAICANQEWVVCEDCSASDWELDENRYATTADGLTTLVKRNLCHDDQLFRSVGITNLMTLFGLLFVVGIFSYYLKLREIRFDEDKVTTTDYSVVVKNPPPDALDPDEWRSWFEQFAEKQVTCVTIALDNHELVRRLVSRRIFRNQLKAKLPKDFDMDDKDALAEAVRQITIEQAQQPRGCFMKLLDLCVFPLLYALDMFLPANMLLEKNDILTKEILELQKEKYNATEVFITFETEEGQRAALSALTVGKINSVLNRTSVLPPGCLFHGQILKVMEPEEPNAIRWLDLNATYIKKISMRTISFLVTCAILSFAGFLIAAARNNVGPPLSGPLTSIFNSMTPFIVKILMIFEPHATEGSYQASLYLKITLVRWVLSGILAQIITPFTSTLGQDQTDLLRSVYAILLADVWLAPLLRLLDIMSNFQKHLLAPRANTQEEMNMHFQGTFYNLGERYTDFTKVLFVCFFYSALFPSGFFFGSVILFFQYLADRYCLMRIWGWTPFIGSQLAVFSRKFFFSGAIIAFAVVSSYVWAQFPYDNVCDPINPPSNNSVAGIYKDVMDLEGTKLGDVEVFQETMSVYCAQNFRDVGFWTFPATPRLQQSSSSWLAQPDENDLTWMVDAQESLTLAYGWFSFLLCALFALFYFGGSIYNTILAVFMGTYEPSGASQHIDFSSNPEIFAFVPQIKRTGYPFPFLICDTIDIDPGLIGWRDEHRSHDFYNVIFDLPYDGLRRKRDDYGENAKHPAGRPIYSLVKHYPPKWQLDLIEQEKARMAEEDS